MKTKTIRMSGTVRIYGRTYPATLFAMKRTKVSVRFKLKKGDTIERDVPADDFRPHRTGLNHITKTETAFASFSALVSDSLNTDYTPTIRPEDPARRILADAYDDWMIERGLHYRAHRGGTVAKPGGCEMPALRAWPKAPDLNEYTVQKHVGGGRWIGVARINRRDRRSVWVTRAIQQPAKEVTLPQKVTAPGFAIIAAWRVLFDTRLRHPAGAEVLTKGRIGTVR